MDEENERDEHKERLDMHIQFLGNMIKGDSGELVVVQVDEKER